LDLSWTAFGPVFEHIRNFVVSCPDGVRPIVWVVSDGQESTRAQGERLPDGLREIDRDFDLVLIHPGGGRFTSDTKQEWRRIVEANARVHLGLEDGDVPKRQVHLAEELRERQLNQSELRLDVDRAECQCQTDFNESTMRVQVWAQTANRDVEWWGGMPGPRLAKRDRVEHRGGDRGDGPYIFSIAERFVPEVEVQAMLPAANGEHLTPWIRAKVKCAGPTTGKVMAILSMHAVSVAGRFTALLQPGYQEPKGFNNSLHLPVNVEDYQSGVRLRCTYDDAKARWAKGEAGWIECGTTVPPLGGWHDVELKFVSGSEELPLRSILEIEQHASGGGEPLRFLSVGWVGCVLTMVLLLGCVAAYPCHIGEQLQQLLRPIARYASDTQVFPMVTLAVLAPVLPGIFSRKLAADQALSIGVLAFLGLFGLYIHILSTKVEPMRLRATLHIEAVIVGALFLMFFIARVSPSNPVYTVPIVGIVGLVGYLAVAHFGGLPHLKRRETKQAEAEPKGHGASAKGEGAGS
jgi:hypothetical protein